MSGMQSDERPIRDLEWDLDGGESVAPGNLRSGESLELPTFWV